MHTCYILQIIYEFHLFPSQQIFQFILFYSFYFFFDNRSQYIILYRNKNKPKKRLKKLIITIIGFAEISYFIIKFLSTILILKSTIINQSQLSIITTILAWVLYIIIANFMTGRQTLVNDNILIPFLNTQLLLVVLLESNQYAHQNFHFN